MPKSSLDWLAVVLLWLGAAVLAIKQADLPLVSGGPAFLASGIWNLVPLALVSAALVIFIYRQLRPLAPGSLTSTRERTTTPATPPKVAEPQAPTRPVPQPQSAEGRIFVSNTLTPYDLMEKCAGKTSHQAKLTLEPYIGKWMRVEGIFEDLSIYEFFACVTLVSREAANISGVSIPDVRAILHYFKNGFDRLGILSVGERVVIDGKITEVTNRTVKFEECELVEAGD